MAETRLNNQCDASFYTDNFKNKNKNIGVGTRRKRSCVGLFHTEKPYNLSNKLYDEKSRNHPLKASFNWSSGWFLQIEIFTIMCGMCEEGDYPNSKEGWF